MHPNPAEMIDSLDVYRESVCVSVAARFCVYMCVIARQSSLQPSAVTLPPCVQVEEVRWRAVATLKRFTSHYAVQSNLYKVYITLKCHYVQTLGIIKKTKRRINESSDYKSFQGKNKKQNQERK